MKLGKPKRARQSFAEQRRDAEEKIRYLFNLLVEERSRSDVSDCRKPLSCGANCFLGVRHDGECLCLGDTYGPGTCPA